MLLLVACAICGGDPAVDAMLVNGAISGALAAPLIFRAQIGGLVSRMRGRTTRVGIGDTCPLSLADRADPGLAGMKRTAGTDSR